MNQNSRRVASHTPAYTTGRANITPKFSALKTSINGSNNSSEDDISTTEYPIVSEDPPSLSEDNSTMSRLPTGVEGTVFPVDSIGTTDQPITDDSTFSTLVESNSYEDKNNETDIQGTEGVTDQTTVMVLEV